MNPISNSIREIVLIVTIVSFVVMAGFGWWNYQSRISVEASLEKSEQIIHDLSVETIRLRKDALELKIKSDKLASAAAEVRIVNQQVIKYVDKEVVKVLTTPASGVSSCDKAESIIDSYLGL